MTGEKDASAEMPGVEEIAKLISGAPFPSAKSLAKARAILALFAPILAEKERVERNRDMWKGQCERQAKTLFELRMQMLADEGQSRER